VIDQQVLEHGSTRGGRWLHRRRTQFAVVIALAEAILLVAGVISRPLALLVAVAVILGYFWLGRRLRPKAAHDVFWIAAVSQALVALVPLLLAVLTGLAILGIAILAVVALIVLFTRR
jgi:hypothetical protein